MVCGYKSYETAAHHNMYLHIITFVTERLKIQEGLTSWPKICFKLMIQQKIGLRTTFWLFAPEAQSGFY